MSVLSVFVTGVVVSPAGACDLCAIYAATEAQGGSGKGFYGGVAEQYSVFGTLQDSGHRIVNDGEYIHSSVSQIFAGYNFNERFGLQFNLPFISRSYGSDVIHGSESGVGDVSLIGNLRLWQKLNTDFTFRWTALAGVKLPTGDSAHLADPDGTFAGIGGHDLALGSGSVDGVVGTGIYTRWHKLFLTANMQYAIRSKGSFGHQYANDWTWSGGPGVYLVLGHHYTLAVQAVVSGESKGKDTASDGGPDNDSAERIVYAGPQINFTWGSKFSAQVGADLPLSIANSGVQVVPDYRIRAAVNWRF